MKKIGMFLLVVGGVVMSAPVAFAADQVPASPTTNWVKVAAGFAMAIASFGGAIGQARASAAASEGMARNPGASGNVRGMLILALVLIESMALYTFAIVAINLFTK